MDPLRNPFSPGAGAPPPELAGRVEILEAARIALHRIRAGRPEKGQMLLGLRGVGKTVLLNKIAEMAEAIGYHVVMLEAPEGQRLAQFLGPRSRACCCGLIVSNRQRSTYQALFEPCVGSRALLKSQSGT